MMNGKLVVASVAALVNNCAIIVDIYCQRARHGKKLRARNTAKRLTVLSMRLVTTVPHILNPTPWPAHNNVDSMAFVTRTTRIRSQPNASHRN